MACADQYTLTREGLTAKTRGLEALSPGYSQVDERSLSDLVLFAKRYASFVRYVNLENEQDGDWQVLMQQDISVAWASLLALDGHEINRYQKQLFKNIDLAYRDGNRREAKKQFKYLFDFLYGLVKTVDAQAVFLSGQDGQGQAICDVLTNKIASPYRKLRHLKHEHPSLFASDGQTDADAPVDVVDSGAVIDLALIDATDETLNIALPATNILNKIHYLAHHNVFAGQVSALLGGVSLAVKNAEKGFAKSISEFSGHEPHYALFLAFLKLFGHAQDSLNQFGKRHLDFYYKEVLRLQNKPAKPDTAFLTFELQKAVSQHKLTKGTLFKGGKDSAGAERQYALLEDVVLNKAKVARLHAAQLRDGRLLVAPEAASADGHGEPIASPDKSWATFGNTRMAPTDGAGFAIASHMLFLGEGTRTVTLRFVFASPLPRPSSAKEGELVSLPFTIRMTGADGWWEHETEATYTVGASQFELTVPLHVSDPPIVPYAAKIHDSGFDTPFPLLVAYFKQASTAVTYQALMEIGMVSLTIGVDVKGVKNLALSNDSGTIDSAKPFKPFGDFPKYGCSFNIGSKEILQKKLKRLDVNGLVGPTVAVEYLHGGAWQALPATKQTEASRYRLSFSGANVPKIAKTAFGANDYLSVQSHEGFIRIRLQDSTYSLDTHIKKINDSLNQILLKVGEKKDTAGEVVVQKLAMTIDPENSTAAGVTMDIAPATRQLNIMEPWPAELHALLGQELIFKSLIKVDGINIPTPKEIVLDAFSVDYVAEDTLIFPLEAENHTFYHVHPLGYAVAEEVGTPIVPPLPHAGALYIGLTDAVASTTLSILFEVAEGSANPLKPTGQVGWHYLDHANRWREFDEADVVDSTKNFSRSGIVTISLPADAANAATRLEPGLHWLKASVQMDTDTVCRMVAVRAQAGSAGLVQTASVGFREPLPASTITKLLSPDSAVKQVVQPIASFGGRPAESDARFYMRVSERLRHKQRAVTIWDYEHLVLEQFPEVYKVKCINHAGFYERGGHQVFCEHLPGHVTVIPTPLLANTVFGDPLRPYSPVNLLVDIQEYLDKLKDPFVTVHVRNPQFEELKLEFDVKFHAQLDEVFYANQLNIDIERFLCPWAYDPEAQFSYAGKIAKSALINFIDERPYVDYLSKIKLHHIIRDENGLIREIRTDIEEAAGSSARSVLVSHAQLVGSQTVRHEIGIIENNEQV